MKPVSVFIAAFLLVFSLARADEPALPAAVESTRPAVADLAQSAAEKDVQSAAVKELAVLRRQNKELSVHVRNIVADRQVVLDQLKAMKADNDRLRKKDALRRGELAVLKKSQILLARQAVRLERARTDCQQKEARLAKRMPPESLKRENADLHYNLGVVFQEQKRYDAAAREFGLAVKANPGDRDAHFNLALVYDRGQNNRAEAIRHYREYLRLAPDEADAAKVRERLAVLEAEQRVWGQPFAAGLDDREKLGRP